MKQKHPILFMLMFVASIAASVLYVKPVYAANNYPTSERVEYVLACIQARKSAYFELLSKCSCTLDTIADSLDFDSYITYRTDVFAVSIGGERGSVLRDNEGVKDSVKKYKAIELAAQKKCMLGPPN